MPALIAETLTLRGPDAIDFAQAQLSSDLRKLAPGQWQWSAWLNAQGRVRHVLQLVRRGPDELLALLRGGSARTMAAQWRPYVLRRRVELEAMPPCALLDAPALPLHMALEAGDGLQLGMETHALRLAPAETSIEPTAMQHWRLAAIEAGQPWLPESALESHTAPALGLDRLGATSVDKGCYPGQEIVARLHHRGGNKRHLCRIQASLAIQPGQTLLIDGKSAGQVLDALDVPGQGSVALAVMQGAPVPVGFRDDALGLVQVCAAPAIA